MNTLARSQQTSASEPAKAFEPMSENPYAAPIQPSTGGVSGHNRFGYQYKPLRPLAKVLLFAVCTICFLDLALPALDTLGEFLFPGFNDPNTYFSSDTEENFFNAIIGLGFFSSLLLIVSGVLTAIFFYRANANLWSLGVRGLKHKPGWCAAFWFIPIISWFKPYLVAVEIGKRSRPKGEPLPRLQIGLWWTCWIALDVLSVIAVRMAFSEVYFGAAEMALSWVSALLHCLAGYLFVRMIYSFAQSQEALAQQAQHSIQPSI